MPGHGLLLICPDLGRGGCEENECFTTWRVALATWSTANEAGLSTAALPLASSTGALETAETSLRIPTRHRLLV